MFTWLKEKIFGKLQHWFSEQLARTYQELHTRKLQEMAKNIPQELLRINRVLTTLNNNSWAVHHLFKRARSEKQHANAFLYFFYSFELTLKHLIISEMNLRNIQKVLENLKDEPNFFAVHSEKKMLEILEGEFTAGKLIQKFLDIFSHFVHKDDLRKINDERKYIIHNMLKKEMSEIDIEQSFENFFQKTEATVKNTLKEFDYIFEKRPKDILKRVIELFKSEN